VQGAERASGQPQAIKRPGLMADKFRVEPRPCLHRGVQRLDTRNAGLGQIERLQRPTGDAITQGDRIK